MADVTTRTIALAAPSLLGREKEYLVDCIDRNELSWHGKYVKEFEQSFTQFTKSRYAVSTCNGTTALHLALHSVLGPGAPFSEVIVPALTYVATANAVRYCDALPVFCDVDPISWCLNPDAVDEAVFKGASFGRRIRAVIAVHLYGQPCNMSALFDVRDRHELILVEDAAQALGALWDEAPVGSLGEVAAFSFFGNKVVTTGEGGMVTTNGKKLVDSLRFYRGQCQDRAGVYLHSDMGFNYRMSNLQAAVGLAQMERAEELLARRKVVGDIYRRAFEGKLEYPKPYDRATPIDWLFTFLVPDSIPQEVVVDRLRLAGIETRPTFVPLNKLPMYNTQEEMPVAFDIAKRAISLPTHSGMSADDAAYVAASTLSAVGAG